MYPPTINPRMGLGVGDTARGSALGLGVEMPLPLGAQYFTVCGVLLTSLGPLRLRIGSAAVLEAKAHQGSDLSGS